MAYCRWLSAVTGYKVTLPSEAEWEYVARAGTQTPHSFGSAPQCEFANAADLSLVKGLPEGLSLKDPAMCDDGHFGTAPVGTFRPNAFGLYDVHGNVWEWVEDCWHKGYEGAPNDGSSWTSKCQGLGDFGGDTFRMLRSGGWYFESRGMRSADRLVGKRDVRNNDVGFRVVRTVN